MIDGRGDLLVIIAPIGFSDLIGAQAQAEVAGMGHRLDAGGVDRLEGFDETKDIVELPEQAGRFSGVEFESRELGNSGDVGCGERQRKSFFPKELKEL